MILNVPTTIATLCFGIWGIHINWVFGGIKQQGSCNLPLVMTLLTADASIGLIIASLLCVLISYAVASTRLYKLDFIATFLVNIIRLVYSILVSGGLLIATAVFYYNGDCVSAVSFKLTTSEVIMPRASPIFDCILDMPWNWNTWNYFSLYTTSIR